MIDAYNTTLYKYFIGKEEVNGKLKYVIKEEEVDAVKLYTDNEIRYFVNDANNFIKHIEVYELMDKIRESPSLEHYRPYAIYSEHSSLEQAADIFRRGLHGNINYCKIAIDTDTEMLRDLYKDM